MPFPKTRSPSDVSGRLAAFVVAALVLALGLCTTPAAAHRLDVDMLSVRIDAEKGEIAGDLLLNPDMTRPGGTQDRAEMAALDAASLQEEKAQLLSFIRKHVAFSAGKRAVDLQLQVRELYVTGGAAPGDSVIYRATLPDGWHERPGANLRVRIRAPLEKVAVSTSTGGSAQPTVMMTDERPLLLHEVPGAPATNQEEGAAFAGTTASVFSEALNHIWTGIVHIVPFGWDHILFVIALTLGSLGKYRRLVLELSAFTVAHTLTLALGALRVVQVPAAIVEPLIALSITVVAVEQLVGTERAWLRYGLVGFFGLLHGLGFAGVLLDLGFSGSSFVLFLASFNVGVELGQLTVVAATLAVFWGLSRRPRVENFAVRGLAVAIAACGLIVGISRIVARAPSADVERAPSADVAAGAARQISSLSDRVWHQGATGTSE